MITGNACSCLVRLVIFCTQDLHCTSPKHTASTCPLVITAIAIYQGDTADVQHKQTLQLINLRLDSTSMPEATLKLLQLPSNGIIMWCSFTRDAKQPADR